MRLLANTFLAAIVATGALAEAVEFNCRFDGVVDPETAPSRADFSFVIVWDNVTNDAFIRGNSGVSPLVAVPGEEGIAFLEGLPSGAVQTTTIVQDGRAAHSRHTIINITFLDFAPSQYYGRCDTN